MNNRLINLAFGTLLALASPVAAAQSIELRITLAPSAGWPNPAVCGEATRLAVAPGQLVDVCFTVTNRSGRVLDWHTLSSSLAHFGFRDNLDPVFGPDVEFMARQQPLANGESRQTHRYARFFSAAETASIDAAWVAQEARPPALGYYNVDDTVPYQQIDLARSPTARELSVHSPDGKANLRMPFSFNFYGIPSDRLCVANAGAVLVNQWGCRLERSTEPGGGLGKTLVPLMIAPALSATGYFGGGVYYDTRGVAPNRRFIVEWRRKRYTETQLGSGLTFQAIIAEGSGAITFQYISMAGARASIFDSTGLQFGRTLDSPNYLFTAYPGPLTDGKAIRWTPAAQPYTAFATARAQVEVLAPAIVVAPDPLRASAPAGTSTAATLTIGNLGNRPLNWSLGETPASTGFRIAKPYQPVPQTTPGTLKAEPRQSLIPQTRASAHVRAGGPPATARRAKAATPVPVRVAPGNAAAAVPAFGIHHEILEPGSSHVLLKYVSLDAAAPQTSDYVSSLGIDAELAGGFADNDFRQQYLLRNRGCSSEGCWEFGFQTVRTGAQPVTGPSGDGNYLAPAVHGTQWRGMKWDATTNTFYALASTGSARDGVVTRSDLYTLDPATGASTFVTKLDTVGQRGTSMLDIAIAPNGDMYGIDKYTDTLYAIDKRNGHVHPVGPTGLQTDIYDLQSMDFDQSTGVLYYAASARQPDASYQTGIYTVDLATGQATLVGAIDSTGFGLKALAIAIPGGPCVNPRDVPWISFSATGGVTPPLDTDQVTVTLDSTGLSAGVHKAKLCIANDTPFKNTVAVPVEFTVSKRRATKR